MVPARGTAGPHISRLSSQSGPGAREVARMFVRHNDGRHHVPATALLLVVALSVLSGCSSDQPAAAPSNSASSAPVVTDTRTAEPTILESPSTSTASTTGTEQPTTVELQTPSTATAVSTNGVPPSPT